MRARLHWRTGDPELQARVEAELQHPAGPEVLRDNPRRRLLRLTPPNQPALLVKHFRTLSGRHARRERIKAWLGRSPARREWCALAALHAAGVDVPEPLALGRLAEGDGLLVMRFVPGVPLAQALEAPRAARRDVLADLGRAVTRLHEAGFVHGDLHAGNVLVHEGRARLLDLQHASRRSDPESRRRDLGSLDYSLWGLCRSAERMHLRHAALGVEDPRDPAARRSLREVGRAAWQRAETHARSRTRRCLRPGRLYAALDRAPWTGLRHRELTEREVFETLEAHRTALEQGGERVLKKDGRSCVSAIELGTHRLVVKAFPARGAARALADALRGSPARRGWRGGHGLGARGIGAATPLAYLERRRFGLPFGSVLVMEDLRPAPDALCAVAADPTQVVEALTRLVLALHRRGVHHGDLKATHVLLQATQARLEARLIDLEGVRFPGRLSEALRRQALAELNASLPDSLPVALRRRAFERYARLLPFREGSLASLRRVVEASLARRHRFRGQGCRLAEELSRTRR